MARPALPLLLALAACAAAVAAAAAGPDVGPIVAFNNEAQQAVREYGIQSQISSRIYALVHLAQYKALQGLPADADEAVQAAAAAFAGHAALSALFPWRFSKLDKAIKPALEGLSATQKKEAEAAGRAAALDAAELFRDDGFAAYVPFKPVGEDGPRGEYQFAPNQTYAVYPQIATTRPLVLGSATEFKPAPPLDLDSPEYLEQLAEVFELGAKDSANRTQEQTDTARFWADGNTTSSVAGHFNQIAQVLVEGRNLTVREAAQLFALLNVATWDASLSAYTAKYAQPRWRPITAIRQGDGSEATAEYVDAAWAPLLNTPSHPEYPSGHSATAAASAKVLEELLGEQPFAVGTEFPGLAPREYASVQEAVDEVNWSRVYGGIHFRHAVTEGAKLGAAVAEAVIDKFEDKFGKLQAAEE